MAFPGCNLPLVHTVCQAVGSVAGGAAAAVAGGVFDAVVKALWNGLGKAIGLVLTWWERIPTPALSATSGPVGELRGSLVWVTGAIAVGSVLAACGKLALTQDGKPARDIARSMATLVTVAALTVPVVVLLDNFFDGFSVWILHRPGNGQLGARFAAITAALGPIGSGMAFLLAIIGILSSLLQAGLMMVRVAVLVIICGTLPLFAGATATEKGKHANDHAISWLVAFLLYKPASAIVYSAAFWMIGDGKDVQVVVAGITLIALAVLALPALLRLIIPAVSKATESTGAARNAAGAAGMVATGAKHVSALKSRSGSPGRGQPPAGQQAPTGAANTPAGGGGASGGGKASAGAAGAAGAGGAVPVAGAAVAAGRQAQQAATTAVGNAGGGRQ